MRSPNVVKAVLDKNNNALYFSRAPIPWPRDTFRVSSPREERDDCSSSLWGEVGRGELPQDMPALRHIGLYAYRAAFLQAYGQLAPAAIEQTESLEQLRALYHGYKIGVAVTDHAPPSGVDTEQDLQVARGLFIERVNHR